MSKQKTKSDLIGDAKACIEAVIENLREANGDHLAVVTEAMAFYGDAATESVRHALATAALESADSASARIESAHRRAIEALEKLREHSADAE